MELIKLKYEALFSSKIKKNGLNHGPAEPRYALYLQTV